MQRTTQAPVSASMCHPITPTPSNLYVGSTVVHPLELYYWLSWRQCLQSEAAAVQSINPTIHMNRQTGTQAQAVPASMCISKHTHMIGSLHDGSTLSNSLSGKAANAIMLCCCLLSSIIAAHLIASTHGQNLCCQHLAYDKVHIIALDPLA